MHGGNAQSDYAVRIRPASPSVFLRRLFLFSQKRPSGKRFSCLRLLRLCVQSVLKKKGSSRVTPEGLRAELEKHLETTAKNFARTASEALSSKAKEAHADAAIASARRKRAIEEESEDLLRHLSEIDEELRR